MTYLSAFIDKATISNPAACSFPVAKLLKVLSYISWSHSPYLNIDMLKGPFKDHWRSPSSGWSNSDGSYEHVEADGLEANTKRTLRPPGLNNLFVCLSVRLAVHY